MARRMSFEDGTSGRPHSPPWLVYPADHGLVVLVLQAILGPHGLGAEDDAGFPRKRAPPWPPRQGTPGGLEEGMAAARAPALPTYTPPPAASPWTKKPCTRR